MCSKGPPEKRAAVPARGADDVAKDLCVNSLNPKQAVFVAEYLKDSNGSRAAIAAGYSKHSASQVAYRLLNLSPAVMEAVKEARAIAMRKCEYSAEVAMREAEEAIEFAKETKNANALVKAVELRARLNGLIIDRIDQRMAVMVDLGEALREAKARTGRQDRTLEN